jgi:Ca-activated chloride channel family protein
MLSDIIFANPKYFWLFLLLPAMTAWYIFVYNKRHPTMRLSATDAFKNMRRTSRYYLQHLPFVCRCAGVAFVIVALARPQSATQSESVHTEGIDIVLSLDISSTMLAQDFKPNRVEVAKDIATQFIAERISDRIGLVVFAGESFTQCPLTTDRVTLVNLLKDVECGMIEDGTAIGNGLATAVSRLKDSKSVSRVVILLTDGVNNSGEISPLMAAEIAQTYGIRVYTIGVGSIGTAPYPVMTPFGVQMQEMKVEIDEDMMRKIADMTGGKYFRATNNTKLLSIYKEINQMEKAKVEVDSLTHLKEEFVPYALIALLFLLMDILLRLTILRRLP